jgi:hypothetical protein
MFADISLHTSSNSGGNLVNSLIWLVAVGIVCWLLWWFIDYAKVPEPFNKVARVIVALVAVIFLIRLVMNIAGSPW